MFHANGQQRHLVFHANGQQRYLAFQADGQRHRLVFQADEQQRHLVFHADGRQCFGWFVPLLCFYDYYFFHIRCIPLRGKSTHLELLSKFSATEVTALPSPTT